FTNVFAFDFGLNGGNDVLTVVNVALPGPIEIFMGDGNDVLTVTNVFSGGQESEGPTFYTDLGSGMSTATFANVLFQGNIDIFGGSGKDVVTLANVAAGIPGSSENTLFVDLEGGSHNTLTVANCFANFGEFIDDGTSGQITGAHNH